MIILNIVLEILILIHKLINITKLVHFIKIVLTLIIKGLEVTQYLIIIIKMNITHQLKENHMNIIRIITKIIIIKTIKEIIHKITIIRIIIIIIIIITIIIITIIINLHSRAHINQKITIKIINQKKKK